MKKIIFAFSCVFLISGAAVADGRYEIVSTDNDNGYVIVDTQKGRIKSCKHSSCSSWKYWGD